MFFLCIYCSYDFDRLQSIIKDKYTSRREEIFKEIRDPKTKTKTKDELNDIYKEMETIITICTKFDEN